MNQELRIVQAQARGIIDDATEVYKAAIAVETSLETVAGAPENMMAQKQLAAAEPRLLIAQARLTERLMVKRDEEVRQRVREWIFLARRRYLMRGLDALEAIVR